MGAGADLIIRIATKGATLAKTQLNKLGKEGGVLGGKMGKLAKVGMGAVAVALAGVTKGAIESVQAFASFQDKMTQSLAIMNTTVQQQEQMARVAREVASETTIGATQSAEAYFFLASAGLDAEQSMSALPQVAKFAQAGMFDMATATDLATDAQSALGLTVKDAQQNLQNLTRVTDVLVKANTLANATVQQFSEALTNKAGSALKVTNKSIEEGVAVLSAFADRGVKGAEAGEKLNQLLRDVTRAVGKNADEFKKANIQVVDNEGNLKNLADVIAELDKGMAGLSDQQKAVLHDQLGLNRGVADAVKILSGAEEQIKNYENELRNAMGFTEMVAEKQLNSFNSQMQILTNQMENLKITIGQDMVPALTEMVKGLQVTIERLQNFSNRMKANEGDAKKFKLAIIGVVAVLGPLAPVATAVGVAIAGITRFISNGNKKYAEAKEKADQLNNAYQRQIYYLGFVGDKTEEVVEETVKLEDVLDGTNFTVEQLTDLLDENGIALDDNAKEALKMAEAYEDSLLGGIEEVLDALEAFEDRQESINKAETKRNKALEQQTKAEKEVQSATENLDKAKQHLQAVQGLGAQVTAEEELAILRQKQAIQELTDAQDGSRDKELELQIAKAELTRLTEESVAISREEEEAIRAVEQAEKDLISAEEKKTKAIEKVQEAQKALNKLTEQSIKNTLEHAQMQEALNSAMEGFGKGTKGYEDALNKIAELTGVKVEDMIKSYDALFASVNQFGMAIPTAQDNSSSGGGNGGGTGGGLKFPASGGNAIPDLSNSENLVTQNAGGNVVVTVNTGAVLGTEQTIEDAVAKALQEGARRGINVVF